VQSQRLGNFNIPEAIGILRQKTKDELFNFTNSLGGFRLDSFCVVHLLTPEAKMHEYVFEVKFYASIAISARNLKTAKKVLRAIVEVAELDASSMSRRDKLKVLGTGLFLDDEGYPFLAEYDGSEPDDLDTKIV
jgi:hypothetical protein